ncbi:unnamed protein product [Rhizophagus irregularis]|nr:unnamed protein product [Rhizophagus irregularis]CAB4405997.1 unnamed protein product [Rhizophagus irregularis]
MPLSWKYNKERLAKYSYCTHIVQMKKVICHCGKVIKLVSSTEEWESGDDEGMDDDDLFNVDAISDIENDRENEVLSDNDMIISPNNK